MLTMAGMAVAGFAMVLVRMYTGVDLGMQVRTAVGLKWENGQQEIGRLAQHEKTVPGIALFKSYY